MITLDIGDSDEKADWIKMIDGGQARLRDLAASDTAIAQLRAARKTSSNNKVFSPATSRWIAKAFNTSAFDEVIAPERARILATCATTGTGPGLTDDPEGKRLFRLAQKILIAADAN